MFCKPGDTVRFYWFYQSSSTGLGVAGLTVTVAVNRGTTSAVTGASASQVDATNQPGLYYYDYLVPAAYYGGLHGYATTADATVSQRSLESLYISSTDWEFISTLASRLTATRAGYLDNLTNLDGAVSTLTGRLTATRAGYLDNLTNLDTTISSRAASGSTVTTVSAVAQNGDVTIRRGRDYSGAYILTWTLATPPGTTPTSVTLTCSKLSLTKLGTYLAGVITVALSAAETAALSLGVFPFEIEAVISTLSVALVDGTITVEADL